MINDEIARITGLLNPNLIVIGREINCRHELGTTYILLGITCQTRKMGEP